MSTKLSRSLPALAAAAVVGLGGAGTAIAHDHGNHNGTDGDYGGHHGHARGHARAFAADRLWLKHIAQSDLAEIATGTLAQQKGTSQGVKDLGAMLVADHTKHLAQVRALADRFGLALPDAPNPIQQWQAGVLASLSGAAFDSAWISAQIADHQTAIDETNDELAYGRQPFVRALANATLPVITMHLQEAQKLAGGGS